MVTVLKKQLTKFYIICLCCLYNVTMYHISLYLSVKFSSFTDTIKEKARENCRENSRNMVTPWQGDRRSLFPM